MFAQQHPNHMGDKSWNHIQIDFTDSDALLTRHTIINSSRVYTVLVHRHTRKETQISNPVRNQQGSENAGVAERCTTEGQPGSQEESDTSKQRARYEVTTCCNLTAWSVILIRHYLLKQNIAYLSTDLWRALRKHAQSVKHHDVVSPKVHKN